jgi:hypothetical protein
MSSYGQGPIQEVEGAPVAPGTPAADGPVSLSVWERAARVFVSPARAWEGLDSRVQWWIPVLVLWLLTAALLAGTFRHVIVPMQMEQLSRMVESGQIPADKLDKIETNMMTSPVPILIGVGFQAVFMWAGFLALGLVAWFGAGFILGGKISYRKSLEVVSWGALVGLPKTLITFAIAWSNETMKDIHLGLGALLPPEETPTKLHAGLGVLLDAIGPFDLWYLFVVIVGCSVLSGAPRKNVAWVMTGLYLALTIVAAIVSGLMAQGT